MPKETWPVAVVYTGQEKQMDIYRIDKGRVECGVGQESITETEENVLFYVLKKHAIQKL